MMHIQCDERKRLVRALQRAFAAVRRGEGAAVAEVVTGHEDEGSEPAGVYVSTQGWYAGGGGGVQVGEDHVDC